MNRELKEASVKQSTQRNQSASPRSRLRFASILLVALISPSPFHTAHAIELRPGPREVNLRELFRSRMGRKAPG